MWDFRCPQLAGWAGSLLPEQPNCQGNQTAPTQNCFRKDVVTLCSLNPLIFYGCSRLWPVNQTFSEATIVNLTKKVGLKFGQMSPFPQSEPGLYITSAEYLNDLLPYDLVQLGRIYKPSLVTLRVK